MGAATMEEWLQAGNEVKRCPTAFSAETLQAEPLSVADRAALQRPDPPPPSRASWNTLTTVTDRQAPTPVVEAHFSQQSREPSRPIPHLSAEETTTVRVFNDGRREVSTVDHQGRWFISRFGSNQSFQGTTWVNRAAFQKCEVK